MSQTPLDGRDMSHMLRVIDLVAKTLHIGRVRAAHHIDRARKSSRCERSIMLRHAIAIATLASSPKRIIANFLDR